MGTREHGDPVGTNPHKTLQKNDENRNQLKSTHFTGTVFLGPLDYFDQESNSIIVHQKG